MRNGNASGQPRAAQIKPGNLEEGETCRVARETRAFQAQILANIRDAVVAIDENDLISYCNRAFEEMFGWTEQELLGKPFQRFVQDYIKDQYKEAVCSLPENSRKAIREIGEDCLYLECITKNGQSLMVDIRRAVWRGPEGQYKGIIASIRDMTERQRVYDEMEQTVKQRTLKLTLERQRLLDVLETLPVNICLLNADHHLVFSNRAYRERFGDFQGRKCFEALFGYDQPCEFCQTYGVLETGNPMHWEFMGPDGGIFDVYDCPFTDTDGSELVLEMNIEISEQKRAEEALRRSEERFAKIFAASPVIMGITGLDHRFVEINEAFIKAFGYTREEALGRTSRELDMWVEQPHLLGGASKLTAQLFSSNYEVSYRNAAGDERTGLGSTQLITIGKADYYLHTMVDITQQKQIEAELSRLDRLNLIGEMAAAIGHEIRNPLTAVRGFLQMLGTKEDFEDHQAYFELMIEELDRANAIISEYLAMAKNKRVDLQYHFLDDLITTLNPMIVSEANLREMNVKLDLNQPPPALVDHNEFRQLMLNLTRNALDAMQPRGTLLIGTKQEGDEILLYVKDEGCGLPQEIYPKLGTPFITTKDTGTGLGLAVCYSIAARHQALIDFETSSKGTTVNVRFPRPKG